MKKIFSTCFLLSLTGCLNAQGTLTGPGNSRLLDYSTSSATTGYQYGTWYNSGGAMIWGIESSNNNTIFGGSVAYASVWGTNNTTPIHFSPNNLVAMTLMNGGNVGIGITSPSDRLAVRGANSSSTTEFGNTSGRINYLQSYDRVTNTFKAFQFFTAGGTPTMYLDSTGNVGIGTNAASEKLSVNGNISANGYITAKKITITQTGWSDYVFAKGYKLRSLSSLESFIKQNKHLPGVPSAKEVEEKGISVGDNQALLLKKIEELTLYVIELKKENIKQQLQINQLKRKK